MALISQKKKCLAGELNKIFNFFVGPCAFCKKVFFPNQSFSDAIGGGEIGHRIGRNNMTKVDVI